MIVALSEYRFHYRKEVKQTGTYHVYVGAERHMYSVPFKYVGQMVKVFLDVEQVEVVVCREESHTRQVGNSLGLHLRQTC